VRREVLFSYLLLKIKNVAANLSHIPSESAGHTYSPLILCEVSGGHVTAHTYVDYMVDEDAKRLH